MVTNGHCVAATVYSRRLPDFMDDVFGRIGDVMNLRLVSVDIIDSPAEFPFLFLRSLPSIWLFSFGEWRVVTDLSLPEAIANQIKNFCLTQGRYTLRKFVEELLAGDAMAVPVPFLRLGATVANMSRYVQKVIVLGRTGREEKLGKLRKKIGVTTMADVVARNRRQTKIMLIVLLGEVEALKRT
jgi:hypothetical protein